MLNHMRAQWVCSRERRIALYKRSPINQSNTHCIRPSNGRWWEMKAWPLSLQRSPRDPRLHPHCTWYSCLIFQNMATKYNSLPTRQWRVCSVRPTPARMLGSRLYWPELSTSRMWSRSDCMSSIWSVISLKQPNIAAFKTVQHQSKTESCRVILWARRAKSMPEHDKQSQDSSQKLSHVKVRARQTKSGSEHEDEPSQSQSKTNKVRIRARRNSESMSEQTKSGLERKDKPSQTVRWTKSGSKQEEDPSQSQSKMNSQDQSKKNRWVNVRARWTKSGLEQEDKSSQSKMNKVRIWARRQAKPMSNWDEQSQHMSKNRWVNVRARWTKSHLEQEEEPSQSCQSERWTKSGLEQEEHRSQYESKTTKSGLEQEEDLSQSQRWTKSGSQQEEDPSQSQIKMSKVGIRARRWAKSMSDRDEQSQDLSKKKTQVKVTSDQDEQSQDQSKKKSQVSQCQNKTNKVRIRARRRVKSASEQRGWGRLTFHS